MRVVLHPEADREYAAAAQHYEALRQGLGAEFITAVDEAVSELMRFPLRWRVIEDEIRRGLLRRFPYAFYYWEKIPGEELEILSIGHSKRHPLYWKSRRE